MPRADIPPTPLILAALLTLLTSPHARAETYTWSSPPSGDFSSPANWSPASPPGPLGTILFDTPTTDYNFSTTLTLSADTTLARLTSRQSGHVYLDLNNFSLHLNNSPDPAAAPDLTLEAAQDRSYLIVDHGPLDANNVLIGAPTPATPPNPNYIEAQFAAYSPVSIANNLTVGLATPGSPVLAFLFAASDLTVGNTLTVGAGAGANGNAYLGYAAAQTSINRIVLGTAGGSGSLYVGQNVSITHDLLASASPDSSSSIFLDAPGNSLHVGGDADLAPGSLDPNVAPNTFLYVSGGASLLVDGALRLHPGSLTNIARSPAAIVAPSTVLQGHLTARHATLRTALTDAYSLTVDDVTLDGPLTLTPSAEIHFAATSVNTFGPLQLNSTADLRGNLDLDFDLNAYFAPLPGDRFDLITSPTPLDLSHSTFHVTGLASVPRFHLDTSHGLSVIFDSDDGATAYHRTTLTAPVATVPADLSNYDLLRFPSGTHAASLPANLEIAGLLVDDGDAHLDLASHNLRLTGYWTTFAQFIVGAAANAHASLSLSNGNVFAYNVSIAFPLHAGDATGALTLQPGSSLTADAVSVAQTIDGRDGPGTGSPLLHSVHANGSLLVDHAQAQITTLTIGYGPNATGSALFRGPSRSDILRTLSIGDAGGTGSLLLQDAATLVIHENLSNTGHISVGPTSTLYFLSGTPSQTGDIDLAGSILFAQDSPAAIRSVIAPGQISSSLVAANPLLTLAMIPLADLSPDHTFTDLPSLPPDTLLLTPAYLGDANLDGSVDPTDAAILDAAYQSDPLDARWATGDFNADGILSPADFLLLDRSTFLLSHTTPTPAFLSSRESQFGESYVSSLLTSIPEPASPLPCLFAGSLLLNSRNRRKNVQ